MTDLAETHALIRFAPSAAEHPPLRVLFVTNMWPDAVRPHYGTFIGVDVDVDVDAFAPRPKADARRALGWPIDGRVALFMGDPADQRKNYELAAAAAAIARRTVPNLRLHLGWGSRPEEIPRLMWAADCPLVPTPVGDVPRGRGTRHRV